MAGRIIGTAVTGCTGILLIVLGMLIYKKQMISLMHDYHVDKVSRENRAAFCRLSGLGLILTGIGAVIAAAFFAVTESAYSFLAFAAGLVPGIGILIAAGRKYNN
ncbi:MAG: DUF3784 domain-containing protein [Lachnospiraceae bacterium]|nr:DUF3784 domain-containing protein [Lachnospiraceae bacterium]